MHRRKFLAATLAGTATAAALIGYRAGRGRPEPALAKAPTKGRMKVGHQQRSLDADLRVLATFGVRNICSALPSRTFDDNWSGAGLSRLRERVERFGIALDMVPLPMSSA